MSDRTVEVAEAAVRASRLYPDSKQFQRVYMRGARAKLDGKIRTECPYESGEGWRQAFRLTWVAGYDSIVAHR